ncbi:FeoA family protein [Evansella tamaricis]|uniref:Ferrous iron transport protein A n=1 Tax=Evansella tamaricis TaxID=2069301 RepID=A0ABS6JJU5_9BACI|nr:FeoA family protein [Evansella tamaricis]MBU9713469.1 ferrous iron transport protein A [Evansella tamaricis]
MKLSKCKKNCSCVIKAIPNDCPLSYLGICEGLHTKVVSRMPLGGPVLIHVGKRKVALGKEIADQILIEEVR